MIAAPARHLRAHWLLALLLLGGVVLRVLAQLAYRPALLYIDSFRYLDDLGVFYPGGINPIGYEILLLGPLLLVGNLAFVVAVQHLIGLALGVAVYVLLLRFGARRWIAALATAPVLLDAYQVQIEHNIMSDLLFQVLLLAAIFVLTWRGTPGPRTAAIAGLLLATSVLVRIVGLTLVVPAVVFVLLAAGLRPRDGWKPRLRSAGALAGAFLGVLFCYSMYHLVWTGTPALGGSTGSVVYGRTAVVADCANLGLTPEEQRVCPKEPVEAREKQGIDFYIHFWHVSANTKKLPDDFDLATAQSGMAAKVLAQQPFDVLGGFVTDFLKGFAPTRTQTPGDVPLDRWQFKTEYPMYADPWYVAEWSELYGDGTLHADTEIGGFLRAYQLGGGYTPGTVLGGLLVLSGLAVLGVGRARRSGLRAVTLLPAGLATTVLATAAAMEFSWRYQLPGLVLVPLAGGLALTAIIGPRPTRLPDRPTTPKETTMSTTYPDEVDRAALDGYAERYGDRRFASVVVLIAAYNEQDALGAVLDGMPAQSCGLDVDTLVVVDGATDDTAEVALRHGAQTCVAPVNRGQGAALRLGYRIAAERGARYLVTTDADGQYDIAELPQLLQPLIDDEADFVTGSRTLGRTESTDLVRRAGTHVFAWLVSALTGQKITDTSFGFRGMKIEVPNSVRLEQKQYQSSELLVGVLARGYRVLERPMTMLARTAGQSKKGNNVLYGYRYAKVVLGTWLRERRSAPQPQTRPASERINEPAVAVPER
ncbi:glycosyltransferase family 2 protein [Saccharopolyspora gloriosae]|uniref:glycosyltransferase family 2 protein n=1 Tax=Saccharopolyspora gloriosae TaxID=455344 RepID=UPI001FB6D9DE|nr:glycosyltransferase family 2 protein [Saccharopolyspora gloriosae]